MTYLALSQAQDNNEQVRGRPHSHGWGRRKKQQTHKQGIYTVIVGWAKCYEINHVTTKTSEINSRVLTVGEDVYR